MNRILTRLTQVAVDPALRADGQLLDAFLAERSEAAFRELVSRHGGLVFGVCRRLLRHRQDAEDAFQAVFLVLARRAADVRPRDAVSSWLYGVAHRVALKARSVRARRLTREQSLGEKPPVASPSGSGELAELIHAAVGKLPDVYRVAIVACDLEGLSRAEAAGRLGWKEGTLSGRLARARQLLADRLRRTGVTLPAGGVATGLGMGESVRAGLAADTVRLAVASAGGNLVTGASAPVVALTEGVVRGMFLAKLKTAVTMLLAVGTLGFGMWSAAGAGNGPGETPGGNDDRPGRIFGEQKQPAKRDPDLEKMQGTWWILSIGDGNKMQPIDPNTQSDPRQFAITIQEDQFIFPRHPAFQTVIGIGKITLDPTKNPKHIDIAHEGGTFTGVYEFVTPKPNDEIIQLRLSLPHVGGVRSGGFLKGGLGAVELVLGKFADPKRDPTSDAGLAPGVKRDMSAAEARHELVRQELELLLVEIKNREATKDLDRFELRVQQDKGRLDAMVQLLDQVEAEVVKARLRAKPAPKLPDARSSDLARMQGRWRVASIWDGLKQQPMAAKDATIYEIVGDKFYGPLKPSQERGEKPYATIVLRPDKSPAELDFVFESREMGKNIYRFTPATQPGGGNLWIAGGAKDRPTSFEGLRGQVGVLELTRITDEKTGTEAKERRDAEREQAKVVLEEAKLMVALAQADLEKATFQAQITAAKLAEAEAKLAAAKKVVDELDPTPKFGLVVRDDKGELRTLTADQASHVRSLASAMLGSCCGELAAAKGQPFATAELWEKLEKSGHVAVTFDGPRVFKRVGNNPAVTLEAILIPVAAGKSPDFILIRDGKTYRAFFDFHEEEATELRTVIAGLK